MSKKNALIVIGRFKEEWRTLSPHQQNDFVEHVGEVVKAIGLQSITSYHLVSTPGAFLQVWEANSREAIDQAVKKLDAIGYSRYIDARWMIGERETM